MAFLIFEGVDKVGKTTLLKAVDKATNYEHFCIDRGLGSAYVYDLITKRRDRFKKLEEIESELSHIRSIPIITILLTCKKEILIKRIKTEDENSEERIAMLGKAISGYEKYKEIAKLPLICVDTTNKTVKNTVKEIIKKIKKYEEQK